MARGSEPAGARRLRARVGALAIGSTLAFAGVQVVHWMRERSEHARFERAREAAHELIAERATTRDAPSAEREPSNEREPSTERQPRMERRDPRRRELYLTPQQEGRLFYRDKGIEQYDPWSYFRHRPDVDTEVTWPDHPRGAWRFRTNSLGLREDRELATAKPALRILVTGDSHVDGFCDNADSFPHRMEAELLREDPARAVEAINAANGGFSFYNYIGALERFLDLEPDAFVVVVYAGNDFYGLLMPYCFFERVSPPTQPKSEFQEAGRIQARFPPAFTQVLQQVLYFRAHPEWIDRAVDAALDLTDRMRAICVERDARFVVVLLPAPRVDAWPSKADEIAGIASDYGLSAEDLAVAERLAARYVAGARARGVEIVDASDAFASASPPHFWARDWHLDLRGHQRLAELVAPLFRRDRSEDAAR